jgi:hypothetical protein
MRRACKAALLGLVLLAALPARTAVAPDDRGGDRGPVYWWIGSSPVGFSLGLRDATLRLLNPTADAISARVISVDGIARVTIEPGGIVERPIRGRVIVESRGALIVTARSGDDEGSANEGDEQLLVAPVSTPKVVADAACTPIVVGTSSSACRFGTSGAAVEAIPGATYSWTVDGATITSGDGTNRITLAFGAAASATVAVAVHTSDGCTRNGAASIALRDPFRIVSLVAPMTTIGDPVTIAWAIAGSDVPRSQTLTINGSPVKIAVTDRSYTFTPATIGSYSVQLDASLIGGKRRACCRSTTDVPAASFCGADSRTASFTVAPACEPTTAALTIGAAVTRGGTLTGSVTANGSWTLTSALGNPISPASGTGSRAFTYTASAVGNDILTMQVNGPCTTVTRTASLAVTWGIPTVALTADSTTVTFGRSTTLHVMVGNAPTGSETSYAATSSEGNDVDRIATAAGDSATFQYSRDNFARNDDTVTVSVTSPGGTGTASIVFHDDTGPCSQTPAITNISVTPATIPLGGTATIRFTITSTSFSFWSIGDHGLGNTMTPLTGRQVGDITVTYTSTSGQRGVDPIDIQAYGKSCGTTIANLSITVN